MNRAEHIVDQLLEASERFNDLAAEFLSEESIQRDLKRMGWDILPKRERWQAVKEFHWQDSDVGVVVTIVPRMDNYFRHGQIADIRYRDSRGISMIDAGNTNVRLLDVVKIAAQMEREFAQTPYATTSSWMSNLDSVTAHVNRMAVAAGGTDMWESSTKDFILNTDWESDPKATLRRMGFEEDDWGTFNKLVQLPVPYTATDEDYFTQFNNDLRNNSLFAPKNVGPAATTASITVSGPDIDHREEWRRWHRINVSLYVGGYHEAGRQVGASKSAGDLSTRLIRVIGDLERALQEVDASDYGSFYDYTRAIDRAWGKQPNRIVKPYKRKKR